MSQIFRLGNTLVGHPNESFFFSFFFSVLFFPLLSIFQWHYSEFEDSAVRVVLSGSVL